MSKFPKQLSINDYTYDLPEGRIAFHPLPERDASKLLVYRDSKIHERIFRELPQEIPSGTLLVFNTTRVVRVRLLMQRVSGATVEIFCTGPAHASVDFVRLLQAEGEAEIKAFVGNGKRWKEEEVISLSLGDGKIILRAKRIAPAGDQSLIRLSWTPGNLSFAEILDAAGKIPLPPYIDRDEEENDAERYQTVYAREQGSVAAPTAGLHFTQPVLDRLAEKNVRFAEVALHVGAGTFKPVKSETMEGHEMHSEQVIVSLQCVEQLIAQQGKPLVATGTTALRTLESLYWFGRQLVLNPGRYVDTMFVGQWEPYDEGPDMHVPVALRAVRDWMRENNRTEFSGYTQLLIAPGYTFKLVTGLITNFHQPKSTLLLLVAAFIGEDFRNVYDYALQHDFRFLSYGDSSLLWRK